MNSGSPTVPFSCEVRGKREHREVRALASPRTIHGSGGLARIAMPPWTAVTAGSSVNFHAVGPDVDTERAVGREAAGHRHRHVALVVEHVGRRRAANHRRHREADRLRRAAGSPFGGIGSTINPASTIASKSGLATCNSGTSSDRIAREAWLAAS